MKPILTSTKGAKKPVEWILLQQTNKGPRYYTGRAHPISPDAWTPNINRAEKMSWDRVANMREFVSTHTFGQPIEGVRF